jgi:hypothetical protein
MGKSHGFLRLPIRESLNKPRPFAFSQQRAQTRRVGSRGSWLPGVWGDFKQRLEHEGSFADMRMWHEQSRLHDDSGMVYQKIEIDPPRPPANLQRLPAHRALNAKEFVEERAGLQGRVNLSGRVEESGLIEKAPGFPSVQRGTTDNVDAARRGEPIQRFQDLLARICQIAAQPYEYSHDRSSHARSLQGQSLFNFAAMQRDFDRGWR